jgi:CDP-glucose 4,6-dehydratase
MAFFDLYNGRRVLVTGHTGFKGSWLCQWLLNLGAKVCGLGLEPTTDPSMFNQLRLSERIQDNRGDICDLSIVEKLVDQFEPEIIFHLAAQPLVRVSYKYPVATYLTNVMGTAHALEAVRKRGSPCAFIAVTTDKCYENREWVHSYREDDQMGGHDPYSSSKGAAELIIASYRRSYFSSPDSVVQVASARAGNVIGGGDWSLDRIVPDSIRALSQKKPIIIRNKEATRPWQHVLEPLSGYLWLGAKLFHGGMASKHLASAFNFGPNLDSNKSVGLLVGEILKNWPGEFKYQDEIGAVHEAKMLNLAIDKAKHILGWAPVWGFEHTVAETVNWYKNNSNGSERCISDVEAQILKYTSDAKSLRVAWANQ